jgi:hypothetical protein
VLECKKGNLKFEQLEHEKQIKVKTLNVHETEKRKIPFKAFKSNFKIRDGMEF